MSISTFLRLASTAVLLAAPAWTQSLAGKVVADHTGAPVPSVSVRIFRIGRAQVVADLDTTGDGRFEAPGLPAAGYRLEISKPNYIATTLRLHYEPASPPVLIRLVRCGVISGSVLDPQGRPVIGARVFALPKPPGNAPLQNRFAQVDDQGQFRLYQLPPGEYSVAVTYGASTMAIGSSGSANVSPTLGSGVLFYPQSFTVTSGEEYANINFSLSPGALYSVSGKLDIAPNASGTFWLALTPADQPALAAAVTQAERDGSFHLAGAGPGSYHLFASGPSNVRSGSGAHLSEQPLFGRTSLIIGAQDLEGVTVPLEKGRSLPARYETSGRECPPTARLALTALEDWAAVLDPSATLTAGTTQVVANLAPARYQASLSGLGPGCYVEATTVDLSTSAEAKPLILRARPSGSLRGRLTGATQPAAYAILLAGEATQLTVPDPAGRFEFANLRPGTYRIGVQPLAERPKSNWLPAARFLIEVEVPGGAPTDLELPAPNAEGDPSHD